MLAHHETKMRTTAIPIFQKAVTEDPELFIEARAQISAAVYAMRGRIVQFDNQLSNMSYFPSGQGKRKADTEDGWRKRVCKE